MGFDSSLTLTANMQQVFRQLYTQVKVYTIAEDYSKQDDHLNPYSGTVSYRNALLEECHNALNLMK